MCVISYSARGKYFILLASSFMFPISAFTQCVDTQDCQALGYTETSNSGNCVKCPFGDYWSCPKHEEEKAVLGQCTGYAKNCSIGQILNSDGTCTNDKVSAKTPIAVVVYIGSDNCGQALALESLGMFVWSTEIVDIPDLPTYDDFSTAKDDFDSCGNTQKIIKQGDAFMYPAAWAAANYAPTEIPTTKGKWCLPAAGIARSMRKNNYLAINSGLSKAGGEVLPSLSDADYWNWSSSEGHSSFSWAWNYGFDDLYGYTKSSDDLYVRPVIAF